MRKIKTNERLLLVGKTGSGKTYLARLLTLAIDRLIVVDPKGTLAGPGWNLEPWSDTAYRELARGNAYRARFPAPISDKPEDEYEKLFALAYRLGDLTVYIDEMYAVVSSNGRMGKWLRGLYTRGRELGIGVWGATQRPTWIPRETISESDWFFMFALQLQDDRDRMSEVMGPLVREPIPRRDRYGVWVYYTGWESPLYRRKATEVKAPPSVSG